MSNVVNMKHLVKLIRKTAKDTLIWQRTDDAEYITNSHWLVKVSSTAHTDVRGELFKVFGKEAQVGDSFCKRFGEIRDKGPDCTKIHSLAGTMPATLTPVIVKGEGKEDDRRIVRLSDGLAAISNDYAELTLTNDALAKDATSPIYFGAEGEILILPIRVEGGWAQKLDEHLGKAVQQ